MAGAGFRLEGWALWSQLATIAALLTRWRAHPPSPANETRAADGAGRAVAGARGGTGAPGAPLPSAPGGDGDHSVGGVAGADTEDPDGDIRERADAAWDAAVRRARLRMPTPADMVEECVAAEVSLACGLSQSRAADRVLAADLILLDGKLPRTARLLQAGLLDWPKIQLLTHRLGVGTDAVLARLVERTLIPDEDLAALDALEPVLDDRVDAAPLPQVTRMTLPGLAAAIEATIAALDAEAAAERARAARDRRCVSTRMDPDGMGRLEASTGAEQVAAMWSALTAAARQAKRGGDGRTLDQLRLDELVTRVTGLQTTDRSPDRLGRRAVPVRTVEARAFRGEQCIQRAGGVRRGDARRPRQRRHGSGHRRGSGHRLR